MTALRTMEAGQEGHCLIAGHCMPANVGQGLNYPLLALPASPVLDLAAMRPPPHLLIPGLVLALASASAAAHAGEPAAGTVAQTSSSAAGAMSYYAGEKTRILSKTDARRLLANKGVTLQWIDWNTRGSAFVDKDDGLWLLRAAQVEAGGPGRLFLEGRITEIGPGYFTFDGLIRIADTPDRGRICEKRKIWHFAITQHRPYYRLREFEWCDDLTDYIDIYFVPVSG